MNVESVEGLTGELRAFFSDRGGVDAAYLFGSAAAGKQTALSDLDVGVLFSKELPPDTTGISADLGTLFGRPVDVVDLETTPPVLTHRAFARGVLILSKNESRRLAFEVMALKRYADTAHLRRIQDRALAERIKQGRFGR